MSPFTRNYLEIYLESRGKTVPTDIHIFAEKGSQDHLCFLCGEEHNYVNPSIRKSGHKVRTCQKCQYEIDISVVIDNPEYDEKLISKDLKYLLDNFRVFGHLPMDVPGNLFSESTCGFCKKKVSANDDEFAVPVGTSRLYYDTYKVCSTCSEYLGESLYASDFNDQCCIKSCEDFYPVTHVELKTRKGLGTLKQHVCPPCYQIEYGSKENFAHLKCDHCHEVKVYDMSHKSCYGKNSTASLKCSECRAKDLRDDEGPYKGPLYKLLDGVDKSDIIFSKYYDSKYWIVYFPFISPMTYPKDIPDYTYLIVHEEEFTKVNPTIYYRYPYGLPVDELVFYAYEKLYIVVSGDPKQKKLVM